jgi:hypothetical protein
MVTAFVAGPSLEQILSENQALSPDRVRILGAGVAEALGAIHAAGLIHRDLKPSNILLADDGPHVIDFGIARAIDASGVTGRSGMTGFMAPEVFLGQPLTCACDVFALGVVLAHAVGIRPFGVGLPETIAYRIVHDEPDLSGLDPQIREVVAACLAKEPSERPAPARILELLADPDLPGQWLPSPGQITATAYGPPGKPTAVADTDLSGAVRLLEEAERIARALSLAVQRARALVHVATVTARSDPAHAAQLLDDALHPSGPARYQHLLEALVWHSASEVGLLLARIDPSLARGVVSDLGKLPPVIRALNHREFLDDVAPLVTKVAEVVAEVDVASAEELVWPMGTPARDMALARVAAVAARNECSRAGDIAFTVIGRRTQAPDRDRREREGPPPPSMLNDPDRAIYWKVRALTEVAVVMAGADSDRAQVRQLLSEADELARVIGDADLQSMSLTSVKVAAAQIDPDHAGPLLTEAEQYARAIASPPTRLETLEEVALAAARIDALHAEQVISSLPPNAAKRAEIAMMAALIDPACGERIAAGCADRYLYALVRAVIAVRADPAEAEPGCRGETLVRK